MKMKDLSQAELSYIAGSLYGLYGSNITTARVIFQGLNDNSQDVDMLGHLADFFTESHPEAAAVIYYHLFSNITIMNTKQKEHFMIMFSDAMYQYGLSKHKTKTGQLTLGDIYDYSNFEFNIAGLREHAEIMSKDFGSIQNFVLVIESTLGMISGFVEKSSSEDILQSLPSKGKMLPAYAAWLDSYPEEVNRIRKEMGTVKK